MGYLAKPVLSVGVEWPFTPIQEVQGTVPKSYESKSENQIDQESKECGHENNKLSRYWEVFKIISNDTPHLPVKHPI